jgi:hypothetical protein
MAKGAQAHEARSASSLEPDSPTNTKDAAVSPPSELSGSDESGYSTEKNPFADPETAEHWRQAYEKSQYECRHVFDPTLRWTEEEEKKIVRKLDWRICLWAVSYLVVLAPYRPGPGDGGPLMALAATNAGNFQLVYHVFLPPS